MAESKRSLAEIFRPSKNVRETVPAESKYQPGKAAVQYYARVVEDLKAREKKAKARLEDLQKEKHAWTYEDGKLIIPATDATSALKAMKQAQEMLQNLDLVERTSKAIDVIEWLAKEEENDTNKQGMDELRERMMESDALVAAAMTEEAQTKL